MGILNNNELAPVSVEKPEGQVSQDLAVQFAQMAEAMAGLAQWRLDVPTNQLCGTHQILHILGLERQEGRPSVEEALQRCHPDDRARVVHARDAAVQEGRSFSIEARIIWPNGEVRSICAHGAPEYGRDGSVEAVFGALMDITETKRAIMELAASEARFRHLAENAGDIIVIHDPTGRLEYVSPSVKASLGFEPAELIGRKTTEIIHPDDLNRTREAFSACAREEGPPVEYRVLAKDGRTRWFDAHPKALFDPATGKLVGYQDSIRDITDRKAADLRVAEIQARYDLIASHSKDVLIETDLEGRITFISSPITQITGAKPEDLLGRHFSETMHRDDVALVEEVRRQVLKSAPMEPNLRAEYRSRRANGEWMWFETTPIAIVDPTTQRLSGMLDIARDVTERKTLEAELERKCAEAEAASVAKSEFLANMSHEIRTPLTAVLGFSDLLRQADLPIEARRHAERVSIAGRTLLTVVNDILDFSKLEAGKVELDEHAFSVKTFVEETLDLERGQAEAKGLDLSAEMAVHVPAYVRADAGRLRQILLNLLANAVKFTSRGAVKVTVDYDAADSRLRIAVEDTGIGVPDHVKARLFQRFVQADGSNSREFGGTGLGLAICKGLAELMGGEVGVESADGGGSIFWFTCHAPRATPVVSAPAMEAASEGEALRILVVDDVAANRQLVQTILCALGHEVVSADGGGEAVRQAIRRSFDLILMDLQMPGMDGLAATRAIRMTADANRETPIIALSANVLPEQVAECLAAGMDDHVAKPIQIPVLLQKIEQARQGRGASARPLRAAVPPSAAP